MSNENQMPLGAYIFNSLKGAWKLVQANPKSMEYLDLSTEGFWKSFWAIAVMVPGLLIWTFYNYQGVSSEETSELMITYPYLSNTVFFFIALPFTAFVMIYFTKFMKIDANYMPMVIAYNWMSAVVYLIMAILTVILGSGLVGIEVAGIMLMVIGVYFSIYVHWFTFKVGLQISGLLAAGVLIFVKLLDASLMIVLYKVLNPDHFNMIVATINNQPS
ncbi:MAG: hypothetical protein P8J14_11335 [Emcibacteraceae bacterium]|nr:hypothetical protein [Emcibacteraceae bacterium]